MATKERLTRERACLHGFTFVPIVPVPKLQMTSSCLLLTLLTFATARVIE